jgi:hypothetical protein
MHADVFLSLDKDMNGTLSKQELQEYAEGTLTEIFIERGKFENIWVYNYDHMVLWGTEACVPELHIYNYAYPFVQFSTNM